MTGDERVALIAGCFEIHSLALGFLLPTDVHSRSAHPLFP
jgi:hypothetical protein